jgi:hypothetical protein
MEVNMPRLQTLPPKLTSRELSMPLRHALGPKGNPKICKIKSDRGEVEPNPGLDLSKAYANGIWRFKNKGGLLRQINKWLAGGESFPFLTAFLGVTLGVLAPLGVAVSTGAGISWSYFCASISEAKSKNSGQCFARPGDQFWMVEAIGLENRNPTYMRQYWIVDPFRNGKVGSEGSSWCIGENRFEIKLIS